LTNLKIILLLLMKKYGIAVTKTFDFLLVLLKALKLQLGIETLASFRILAGSGRRFFLFCFAQLI